MLLALARFWGLDGLGQNNFPLVYLVLNVLVICICAVFSGGGKDKALRNPPEAS